MYSACHPSLYIILFRCIFPSVLMAPIWFCNPLGRSPKHYISVPKRPTLYTSLFCVHHSVICTATVVWRILVLSTKKLCAVSDRFYTQVEITGRCCYWARQCFPQICHFLISVLIEEDFNTVLKGTFNNQLFLYSK